MLELLGVPNIVVTIGVTVILLGFAALMTGQALAATWRPYWHAIPYSLLLAFGDRFLIWGLFGGSAVSVTGYVIDWIYLLLVSTASYRATRARQMVRQYPWLYERAGLFSWRERPGASDGRPA